MSNEKSVQQLADEITEYLFTNGAGEKAQRLVLELADGVNAGGWSRGAVCTVLVSRLKGFISAATTEAREATLIEARNEMCPGCRAGATLVNEFYHADGYATCQAFPIRELLENKS